MTAQMTRLYRQCAAMVNVPFSSVVYVSEQLKAGRTVPFLARYRKDASGGLDERQIYAIQRVWEELDAVEKRRAAMIKSLQQRKLMTVPLAEALARCATLEALEDTYEPYRQKRDRIADTAREKGLEPLVNTIMFTPPGKREFEEELNKDVVAVSKTIDMPEKLFEALMKEKLMQCPAAKEVADMLVRTRCALEVHMAAQPPADMSPEIWEQLEQQYAPFSGRAYKLNTITASTLLALERGSNKGVLTLRVAFAEDDNTKIAATIVRHFPGSGRLSSTLANDKSLSVAYNLFRIALKSAVRAFAHAAIASARRDMRALAVRESIAYFSHNLRRLLLQRPTPVPLLAMDPGFKAGIKCVVLDAAMMPRLTFIVNLSDLPNLKASIRTVCTKHKVQRIVIGNGVASRETEAAVAAAIEEHSLNAEYAVVSETGASVYSASAIAADEFPNMNILFRGAVSIGRRVQDPISELVKIPVKSIGVGVYQHDMPEKLLLRELKATTQSCVSFVGVNVETASKYLLQTVPGVSPKLAEAIEFNRTKIKRRSDLLKVPGMTPELYETVAGSMRVMRSPEPLDRTIIHPEWYAAARKLLALYGLTFERRHGLADAYQTAAKGRLAAAVRALPAEERAAMSKADLQRVAQNAASGYNKEVAETCGVGVEAVKLIVRALGQRTFDPRLSLKESAIFRRQAVDAAALRHGQTLVGVVENVTPFGAFVDVGLRDMVLLPARHPKFASFSLNVGDVLENVRVVVKTEVVEGAADAALAGGAGGFDEDDDGGASASSSGGANGATTEEDEETFDADAPAAAPKPKAAQRTKDILVKERSQSSNGAGAAAEGSIRRRVAINFDQITVQNTDELENLDTSQALRNVLAALKEERARLLPLAIPDGWLQKRQSGAKRSATVDDTLAM